MLRLSTRLMLIASSHLVQAYTEKTKITAPDIAKKCNINPRALMPALRRLTQAGILRSQVGGSEPGFILAKDPAKISMFEIINALGDDMNVHSCREVNDTVNCVVTNCENCTVYKIINAGVSNIMNELKDTSLAQYNKSSTDNN